MNLKVFVFQIFFVLSVVNAESGNPGKFNNNYEYTFGETKFVLNEYCRGSWPIYTFLVYKNDQLLKVYENIAFHKLFASSNNTYFLGVTNSGYPHFAYVIFNIEGDIIRATRHRNEDINYCVMLSGGYLKEWYNEESPDVEFIVENGILKDVLINGCNSAGNSTDSIANDSTLAKYQRLSLLQGISHSDVNNKVYEFGPDSKVLLHLSIDYNGNESPRTLFFHSDSLVRIFNIGFNDIFLSPDKQYFLCTSYYPKHVAKWFIFHQSGEIIYGENYSSSSIHHGQNDYRGWYDYKNPGVHFFIENDRLTNVELNSNEKVYENGVKKSSGKRIKLFDE